MDDPILPEKKRARRRLVGAVTITLAAIIVLPMIFDSEPQTVSQDLLIDIPSRDKPSQTVSREKESAKKKAEDTPASAPADKPSSEPASPAPEKKEAAAKPAEGGKDKPAEKAVAKPEAKTEAKPEAKAKAETKPEAKADTTKKQADPIGQLIAQQQSVDRKDAGQGKFIIQVAAVSTPEKAKEVQDKLQKAGLSSYTQKVAMKDGGERIRIRIGPLPDKKEVNSTCAKLGQLKLPCTLVN